MSSLPKCVVCECTEYVKQSGFYICANCDTQSQELQEQDFEHSEYQIRGPDTDREEITIVDESQVQIRELTSWEYYNYVLKGLIEQLIGLGASDKLKIVAFQVWASYLQNAKAAFFSKEKDKLPALPMGFKKKDAEILYGVKNLKKAVYKDIIFFNNRKRAAKECDEEGGTEKSGSVRQLRLSDFRMKQRKVALSQLSEASYESDSGTSSKTLDTLSSASRRRRRVTLVFKESTKKNLKNIFTQIDKFHKEKPRKSEEYAQKVRRRLCSTIHNNSRKTDDGNMIVNLGVLLSVIRTALQLIGDEIQLGDMLRWISEGRLSINNPNTFIPEHCVHKVYPFRSFTRSGFQTEMRMFTSLLKLTNVPTPNLFKLLDRYCVELCLPNDFVHYTRKIMNSLEPKMECNADSKFFPDYEGRVLAYILFAFKLLFSLDGSTERHNSEFAQKVNRMNSNDQYPNLFSWMDWVRYIECRRTLLSKYSVPINHLTYKGEADNTSVIVDHWHKLKTHNASCQEPINPVFLSALDRLLDKLKTEDPPEKEKINLPASLTPCITYVDYLINTHPNLVPGRTRKILENKFTDYSIKYLLDYKWCEQVADDFSLKVEFLWENTDVNMHRSISQPSALLANSMTSAVPFHMDTKVDVMYENYLWNYESGPRQCRKYKFQCDPLTKKDESSHPKEEYFRIYNSVQNYWFLHKYNKKTSDEYFNDETVNKLPASFLWLLKECADMTRIDLKDLYFELIRIEMTFRSLFGDNTFGVTDSVKILPSDW